MEAYEVVGAPVVRGSDPLGEARRVACSELFGRGGSRQADLEVPVVAEKLRETETCVVGYVLFTETVAFGSGVRVLRVVTLIYENLYCHVYLRQIVF